MYKTTLLVQTHLYKGNNMSTCVVYYLQSHVQEYYVVLKGT